MKWLCLSAAVNAAMIVSASAEQKQPTDITHFLFQGFEVVGTNVEGDKVFVFLKKGTLLVMCATQPSEDGEYKSSVCSPLF